jgi:hypothetical protein
MSVMTSCLFQGPRIDRADGGALPVPRTEIEPGVFLRATDDWMDLSARFVVPVRTARSLKDELTRRIRGRLDDAGINRDTCAGGAPPPVDEPAIAAHC